MPHDRIGDHTARTHTIVNHDDHMKIMADMWVPSHSEATLTDGADLSDRVDRQERNVAMAARKWTSRRMPCEPLWVLRGIPEPSAPRASRPACAWKPAKSAPKVMAGANKKFTRTQSCRKRRPSRASHGDQPL